MIPGSLGRRIAMFRQKFGWDWCSKSKSRTDLFNRSLRCLSLLSCLFWEMFVSQYLEDHVCFHGTSQKWEDSHGSGRCSKPKNWCLSLRPLFWRAFGWVSCWAASWQPGWRHWSCWLAAFFRGFVGLFVVENLCFFFFFFWKKKNWNKNEVNRTAFGVFYQLTFNTSVDLTVFRPNIDYVGSILIRKELHQLSFKKMELMYYLPQSDLQTHLQKSVL